MEEAFDPYLQWLAIRDPKRPPNHYRLLGVDPFESDLEVIQNAADRQMTHIRRFQGGNTRPNRSGSSMNWRPRKSACSMREKKRPTTPRCAGSPADIARDDAPAHRPRPRFFQLSAAKRFVAGRFRHARLRGFRHFSGRGRPRVFGGRRIDPVAAAFLGEIAGTTNRKRCRNCQYKNQIRHLFAIVIFEHLRGLGGHLGGIIRALVECQ